MAGTCPHCGEAIDDGVTTCPHCGREITQTSSVAMQPASTAALAPESAPPPPPVMPIAPPAAPSTNGLAVAALVVGIVGVVLSFTVVFGFVLGGLAIVFGAIAISRSRAPGASGKGMGIAGVALGGLAIFFAVLMIVFVVNVGNTFDDQFSNIQFCVDHPHDPSCRDPRVP